MKPDLHLTLKARAVGVLHGLRGFSGVLVALIAVMICLVITGFALITTEQSELSAIRDSTRQMRLARQASMEADDSVLRGLAVRDIRGPMIDFARAVDKLKAFKPASFPKDVVDDSDPDNPKSLSGPEAIAQLLKNWHSVEALMLQAKWPEAIELYDSSKTHLKLSQLIAAYLDELQHIEDAFAAEQNQLMWMTNTVLAMQILAGVLCVLAFLYAVSRSNNEVRARHVAVVEATQTREQVERLFGMAEMLQSASDYPEANAVLRSATADLMAGLGGALYVFNNSRDRLVLSTTWDSDDLAVPDTIGLNQCWALRRGKPHTNYPSSRKLCCEHHSLDRMTLEIPMVARGEILGLLQVYADGETGEQRLQRVQSLAMAVADAMSLALANIGLREKLRSQALRDPLTGLYNRRYMEDTLQRFVRLTEREQRECSVIMIDLDHFKRLNDQYGHAKGDSVLRDVAAVIVNQLRETDVVCRYGGEELIVLLPECGLDMAAQKAEGLRFRIEALSEPDGAKVSASFGVASIPSTSTAAKDLLAHADAALYIAKQEGRNRVVRATQRPSPAAVPELASTLHTFCEAAE